MEFEDIQNIDQLKLKYKYECDENNFDISDKIFSNLGGLCYCGSRSLLVMIKELINNLKQYKGEKKESAEKYLKRMIELDNYYKNLNKELISDSAYYVGVIRDIQVMYKKKQGIKNIKESCIESVRDILNSKTADDIKIDKKIINIIDIIKDINLYFNF